MKYLRQKLSGRALRIVSTFSLLLLTAILFAGPYMQVDQKLSHISDPKSVVNASRELADTDDSLKTLADQVTAAKGSAVQTSVQNLRQYVSLKAKTESIPLDSLAKIQAEQIKKSPLYRDERLGSSNWFEKAAENVWETLKHLFHFDLPKSKARGDVPWGIFGAGLIYFAWGILAVLVAVFAYFALRHARWRVNLKRKAKAMLEEDEPERTLDEWLERANALEAEGRYREAVRCLYLACLLKFDEARIARFERGQTNWEHLARIQQSPKLPFGLDFEPTTRAFDLIWYGMKIQGKADVDRFRAWYAEIVERVVLKAA